MTLLEVLVASSLALLLLGAAIRLLFFGLSVSSSSAARVALQQTAMVAMERFARDLQPAPRAGVAATSGPPSALCIHPRRPDPGVVAYSSELTHYWLVGTTLRRRQTACPVTGPRAYRPEVESDWAALLTGEGQDTSVTQNVQAFSAVMDRGPLVQLELELKLGSSTLKTRRSILLRQGGGP